MLPGADMVFNVTELSALTNILPYLEQSNVYNSINFAFSLPGPHQHHGDVHRRQRLRLPVRSAGRGPFAGCPDQLHGQHGLGHRLAVGDRPERRHAATRTACFTANSSTRFAAITDGLSNTTFYSERVLADGNNSIVSPIADVFFSPAFPTTPDQAMQLCQAVDITNLANQFPLFMGAPWLCGQHIFLHVTPPNSRSCGFFVALRAVMPPSSRHPGGVNTLFGDGSVKFVKDSVNLQIWRALGTRTAAK